MRAKVKNKISSNFIDMNIKEKPPDEIKEPIKEKLPDDYYKSIKVPIKHILKHSEINLPKIFEVVVKANKLIIHTLQFMKLYLLKYYKENNKTLPLINDVFVNSCMKILCNEPTTGRPPKQETIELKNKLTDFYDKNYKSLIQEEPFNYTHMNTILDYLTDDVITMYENNIKQHYFEYIEKYINVIWRKKYLIDKINRKLHLTKEQRNQKISNLCSELRKIRDDIINIKDNKYKSKPFYHNWINKVKYNIIPNKEKFGKDSIFYDLTCKPQDYLPKMLFMMKKIENQNIKDETRYKKLVEEITKRNERLKKKAHKKNKKPKKIYLYTFREVKLLNVFPLRTEIIPKHIKLDTTTLVHMLLRKEQGNKDFYTTKGNLKKYEDKIWDFFFRTERQCFYKKDYKFHHMILTDGVSCSILLLRNDLIGKRLPKDKIKFTEEYIDELKDDEYEKLQDKKIIAYDPNKGDLIYCVDSDNKDSNKYRYTQDSRRKETKIKKFKNIILDLKKEKIDEKTIIEHETELSIYSRKTLKVKKYKDYILNKNILNNKISKFYENYIFRKLKLNGYINKKKHEQKLIKIFKKIYGEPKDVVICAGDWEQKKSMKYKEPTKGKSIRSLFRRNGYKLYLVDEFRTSCKCSKCDGGNCKNFMVRKNPKPKKDNLILVHGLLSCKNCSNIWNRDTNSASNIYKISKNAINKVARPIYLCRKEETN